MGLLSATYPVPAWPQRAGKFARIGLLLPSIAFNGEFAQYFRDGMRELGWEKGRNWEFEARGYGRDINAVPGVTADLVRAKVDIIVVVVTLQVALAAQPHG